jgi:TonB-dependent receptor
VHDNHKISLNAMRNQNGVSSARYLEGAYPYDLGPNDTFITSELAYEERLMQNYQMTGDHMFPALFGSRLSWRATVGSSDMDDPDRRYFTSFRNSRGVYGVATNTPPYRFYRDMHEDRNEFALDYDLPFTQWNGRLSHFKMGAFSSNAAREFTERQLEYNQNPVFKYEGDPDEFFSEDNVGMSDSTVLVLAGNRYVRYDFDLVVRENFIDGNWYQGEQNIQAYYAMLDLPLSRKLRFIGGARYETTDLVLEHNAKKPKGQIDTQDWLPSANFIYQIGENMNLRFAYGRTLARPSFREVAPYASWDFVGGDTYIGNPELKRTLIDNLDLRWEWFSRPGEIYAVSGFYKNFQDPIETVIINTNREIMWKNVDLAIAYGLEFEARKSLDVITSSLRNFQLGGNLSLVHSEVDISEEQLRIIRETRPEASKKRQFQGQSPFLLNLTLTYDNFDKGFTSSLYYNVFGERLAVVSIGGTPDVYEQPSHLINFTSSYKFAKHMRLSFKVKNILDSKLEKTQAFNGQNYTYGAYNRGREFSLGLKYEL